MTNPNVFPSDDYIERLIHLTLRKPVNLLIASDDPARLLDRVSMNASASLREVALCEEANGDLHRDPQPVERIGRWYDSAGHFGLVVRTTAFADVSLSEAEIDGQLHAGLRPLFTTWTHVVVWPNSTSEYASRAVRFGYTHLAAGGLMLAVMPDEMMFQGDGALPRLTEWLLRRTPDVTILPIRPQTPAESQMVDRKLALVQVVKLR